MKGNVLNAILWSVVISAVAFIYWDSTADEAYQLIHAGSYLVYFLIIAFVWHIFEPHEKENKYRSIARFVLTILFGIFGIAPIAITFSYMKWPYFNTWAMAHGTFVLAFIITFVLSYIVMRFSPWFRS